MKKLLGVSIIAMMAVTPMFAHADKTIASLPLQNHGSVSESSQVATTSYVKGGYNSVANAVNAIVTDMTVSNGTYVNSNKSVAENLILLDTAIGTAGSSITVPNGHYIGESTGHGTVASSLTSLDNEVYNINTTKIGSVAMETNAPTLTGAVKELHDQTIKIATTWNSTDTMEVPLFPAASSDDNNDGD